MIERYGMDVHEINKNKERFKDYFGSKEVFEEFILKRKRSEIWKMFEKVVMKEKCEN